MTKRHVPTRAIRVRQDIETLYASRNTVGAFLCGEKIMNALWSKRIGLPFLFGLICLIVNPLALANVIPMLPAVILSCLSSVLTIPYVMFLNIPLMQLVFRTFEFWLLTFLAVVFGGTFCVLVNFDIRCTFGLYYMIVLMVPLMMDAESRPSNDVIIVAKAVLTGGFVGMFSLLIVFYGGWVPNLRPVEISIFAVTQDGLGIMLSALEGVLLFFLRYLFAAFRNPGSLVMIRAQVMIVQAKNVTSAEMARPKDESFE